MLTDNKRLITTAIYIVLAVLFLAWIFSPDLAGGRPPARLLQSTITGVLVGGIYALVALDIVIINKASGVFNFAHGWMMLIGGMVFYSFFTVAQISLPAAAGLAVAYPRDRARVAEDLAHPRPPHNHPRPRARPAARLA